MGFQVDDLRDFIATFKRAESQGAWAPPFLCEQVEQILNVFRI